MTVPEYSDWLNSLFTSLDRFGPEASAAAAYIREHRTKLSVHEQPTGARWTADRRIEISARSARLAPDHPDAISLVIHEVRHLQQGALTALSVYGELDAWQLQFRFLRSVTGRYRDDPHSDELIEELVALPLAWDRDTLQRGRVLMQAYAGAQYRIDLLPLYPVQHEILFRLAGRIPVSQA